MNFLYELLLKIVSIARGYILCPACNMSNNTYQNRKAPFEESGAESNSEADRQRTKGRRYRLIRIIFIIFIILLCLILAVASPLRCFALGYASETIVELILSALAGTAAHAFLAAGGAELILCIIAGMGAALTVAVIAAAINTAVECGAWQDFVINCQNNFQIRKNQGIMALAMGGTAFLYAYDWVKEHILGLSSNLDNSNNSNPIQLTEAGSSSVACKELYNGGYGLDFVSSSPIKNSNLFLKHRWYFVNNVRVNFMDETITLEESSDNFIQFKFNRITLTDMILDNNNPDHYNYGAPGSLTCFSFYPKISKDNIICGSKINQITDSGSFKIFNNFKFPDSISFKISGNWGGPYRYIDGQIYDCINGDNRPMLVKLKYKDGTIRDKFSSLSEFIFELLNHADYFITRHGDSVKISFNFSNSVNSIPIENKKYYDKSKDTISTTAGSVRTKVKDGSITSDTDGKVSVKVNSPAIPAEGSATAVTPKSKINEQVKVTDISTTLQGVQTMNPGDAITIGSNNIQIGAQPMGDKQPFSALKTISTMMNTLFISKTDDNKVKAPVIPVNFKVMNQHIKFDIDFSPLDPYVGLVRIGLSVSFLITTYLCFKKWLVNKEL